MADTPEEFAAECRAIADGMRRAPREVKAALRARVKPEVAVPLAGKVKTAAGSTGPWSRVLVPGTRVRAGTEPVIVVGGATPKLSGGGGPRSVAYGTEWGGGKRFSRVPAGKGHRGYRRASTNQFHAHRHPFIFPTIGANMTAVVNTYLDILADVMGEATDA